MRNGFSRSISIVLVLCLPLNAASARICASHSAFSEQALILPLVEFGKSLINSFSIRERQREAEQVRKTQAPTIDPSRPYLGHLIRRDEIENKALSHSLALAMGLERAASDFDPHTRLQFGETDYGWDTWQIRLKRGKVGVSTDRTMLVRVGPLFFIDRTLYDGLDEALKQTLGPNAILIPELYLCHIGNAAMMIHTFPAIVAMLQVPLEGKRVVDAGAGDGTLSLVALKLGAAYVEAIEIDARNAWRARASLNANGWGPHEAHVLLADLRDLQKIGYELGARDLETVIVSSVGTDPAYPVNNRTEMGLVHLVRRVTHFIAVGYTVSEQSSPGADKRAAWLAGDKKEIEELGFRVHTDAATFHHAVVLEPGRTLAWIAERRVGVIPPKGTLWQLWRDRRVRSAA